ncbi:MAG: transporter substrate-binding domain-containing protein [Pseudodesulfovibrio sp.]
MGHIKLLFVNILAYFFVVALCSLGFAQERLVISNVNAQPLSNENSTGMLDLLVIEAGRRIGIVVEVIRLPGERSLQNANSGVIDGDILRIGGLEKFYPNLVSIPEKIMDFEFVVFTQQADVEIESWSSLEHFEVGIVTGWKILEINISPLKRQDVQNLDLLFTLLKKNRADVVVYERYSGLWKAREAGMTNVYVVEPPLEVRPMFLYLNNKHSDLVKPLAEALQAMKEDGTYDAIVKQSLESLSLNRETQ